MWRYEDGKIVTTELGDPHMEEFRRYLLGEAPFPEHALLMTFVCTDEDTQKRFFVPGENIKTRDKVHIVVARDHVLPRRRT